MRTMLQSITLLFALLILSSCSAARRVQRIAEQHPELVAVQAHPIDTLISVPSFTDSILVPFSVLMTDDTVIIPTEHGIFTLSVQPMPSQEDKAPLPSLAITYQSDTTTIHYTDTIRYAQVVINGEPPPTAGRRRLHLTIALIGIAIFLIIFFLVKAK